MSQFRVQVEFINRRTMELRAKKGDQRLVTIVKTKTFNTQAKMQKYVAKTRNLPSLVSIKVNGMVVFDKRDMFF